MQQVMREDFINVAKAAEDYIEEYKKIWSRLFNFKIWFIVWTKIRQYQWSL